MTDVHIEALEQTYQLRMELAELLGILGPNPPDPELWDRLQRLSAEVRALAKAPDARRFGELNMEFSTSSTPSPRTRRCADLRAAVLQTARIWLKSMAAARIDVGAEVGSLPTRSTRVLRALAIGDVRSAALIHRTHISMSYTRMRFWPPGKHRGQLSVISGPDLQFADLICPGDRTMKQASSATLSW
ncbi:MAG: hypothetical protein R3D56_03885 [Paracoccaceae bacterium]